MHNMRNYDVWHKYIQRIFSSSLNSTNFSLASQMSLQNFLFQAPGGVGNILQSQKCLPLTSLSRLLRAKKIVVCAPSSGVWNLYENNVNLLNLIISIKLLFFDC